MATGDHPRTAAKIATQTGLVDDAEPSVVLGERLENGDGFCEGERRALLAAEVFARVSPEQKLNLIALHQAAGSVVAMTGDGVNDAPALRKANIGVAMGERGTAAAREAADIVLKDDDLSTLVPAIHEGRVIFDNIRSFVVYLLSCNLSEILVVAVAALAGLPLPLLPLQILFLNLVTDVFPALALGMGDGDANIMGRKPRDVRESLIAKKQWRTIAAYGFVLAASILGVYGLAIGRFGMAPELARTVAFLALAFAQLFHVLNMRGDDSTWLRNEVTQNKWVWAAIAICIGLVLGALYLPVLAEVLALTAPSAQGWWLILAGSLAPVLVGQASKAVLGYRRRIQAP